MAEENTWGIVNDIIPMDDLMICVEVVFDEGDSPHETYRFGNLNELKEKLSDEFLAEEIRMRGATGGRVNNVYFRARMKSGQWRTEYRVGNQSDYDLECIILKEEE